MTEDTSTHLAKDIAVIGMQGRFPGAPDLEIFWRNLRDGVESVSFFDDDELRASGVDAARLRDPDYVRASAILEDIDTFDAAFFDLSPAEAEILDPQHRVFLECAFEALEHAGHDPDRFEGPIGVYAGAAMNTYALNYLLDRRGLVDITALYAVMMGNDKDFLSTRVSYRLDLRGPSVNVQTACSTSLVAIHLACQSLLAGECDMALAGGVSIVTPQKVGYLYRPGMILSPDGHCRPFDAQAQGIVGGNGAGVAVLRRLEDALAEGDTILAVIKGSAINNDGARKAGFTAPSVEAQAAVISEAQAVAGVEPGSIAYVEAHGTATAIGDPIEVAALTKAFGASGGTRRTQFCALGSVKSNVGHLNTAAGIAGFIKTVLALEHRRIPPSLHFERPNPAIDFPSSPFYVNAQLAPWPAHDGRPRRAGVSSFGVGGTNAHVVLEEAPPPAPPGPARRPWHLLVLSARSASALAASSARLSARIGERPDLDLADVAFTLALGRKAFEHRRFVVCRDREEAIAALGAPEPAGADGAAARPARPRPIAFLFSGQGAQYVDMGRELYDVDDAFRASVDRCAAILEPQLGLDLRNVLYPEGRSEDADERLAQTELAQPALFTIGYALARRWMAWGLAPEAMLGHSIGEYVAACLAGVFSLEDALALVAARGKLMQGLPSGAMVAVPLSEHHARALLDGRLSLAAINGPAQCVISGDRAAIARLCDRLRAEGVATIPLRTPRAFHSHFCDAILDAFRARVAAVPRRPPTLPFLSNVSGAWITTEEATSADYWARHLRATVRFSEGLRLLLENAERVLVEIGPGRALATLAGRHPEFRAGHLAVSSLRHPREPGSDVAFLLRSLGQLWRAGAEVDWAALFDGEARRRVPLPAYPFQRERFWPAPRQGDSRVDTSEPEGRATLAAPSRREVPEWFYARSWERAVSPGGGGPASPRAWLIFGDEAGVASRLAERLSARGHAVVSVRAGASFSQLGRLAFRLDPADPGGYGALLERVRADGLPIERVVHLWGALEGSLVAAGDEIGFTSLLYLGRALGPSADLGAGERGDENGRGGRRIELAVVTGSVFAVTGDEALRPAQATMVGPALVLPQEYPGLVCRHLDVELDRGDARGAPSLADRLLDELCGGHEEPVIALRGKHRWLPTVRPLRLERRPRGALPRRGGVVLITGGLGGVGLSLARSLAITASCRLILTGRSTFPARERWDEWIVAHAPEDRVRRTIGELRALEAAGAEILLVSADVTSREQMRAAIAEGKRRFGAIHGVIHAAGAAPRGTIAHESAEEAARAMAAKVTGAFVLDELLAQEPLDFMVLCSSLASVLGGIGLVDYAAANAFLDAFAAWRSAARPGVTVSIGWDGWHEIGMAAPEALSEGTRRWRAAAMETRGIGAEEGAEAFARVLANPLPHVMVSTSELTQRALRERAARIASSPVALRVSAEGAGALARAGSSKPSHPRPEIGAPYVAPRGPVEEAIATVLSEVLGIERVGILDNFFELGASSFLLVQAHGELRKRLAGASSAAKLLVSDLFEYPNIDSLAKHLAEAEGRSLPADGAPPDQDYARERARRQQQAMAADERLHQGRRRERERDG